MCILLRRSQLPHFDDERVGVGDEAARVERKSGAHTRVECVHIRASTAHFAEAANVSTGAGAVDARETVTEVATAAAMGTTRGKRTLNASQPPPPPPPVVEG